MRTVLGCLLALTLIAGCGGNDDEDVRAAVERYVAAVRANDESGVCRSQIAKEFARTMDSSCPEFIDLDKGKDYAFQVDRVWVEDDRAMAVGSSVIKGTRREDQMPFVREEDGTWRISLKGPAGVDPAMSEDQRAVAAASLRFAELVRKGDAQAICDEVTARELASELESLDLDCADGYFKAQVQKLGGKALSLTISEVRIVKQRYAMANGIAANADGQARLSLQFIREGDGKWRITR